MVVQFFGPLIQGARVLAGHYGKLGSFGQSSTFGLGYTTATYAGYGFWNDVWNPLNVGKKRHGQHIKIQLGSPNTRMPYGRYGRRYGGYRRRYSYGRRRYRGYRRRSYYRRSYY